MDATRFDRSIKALAQATGRRDAVRALGASGLALLAALGFTDASAKGPHEGAKARVQADRKRKKKRKKKRGPTGPAGFEFRTRTVISEKSNGLVPEAGNIVIAVADCGGDGQVVSCGYQVDPGPGGGADQFVNTFVLAAAPDFEGSVCRALLIRTSTDGSIAGATIQATAICLD